MPVQLGESSPAPLVPLSSAPPAQLPPLQPGHTQGTSLLHSDLGVQRFALQPREVTVQEGNTVTLQCRMRGDSMRYYTMSWYRQGPTGSQEWIYKEDGTYGEGFKDRFKIKEEKLKNSFTLQILAAKQGDAATYYCRGWHCSTGWLLQST
uniref:Ig-like domain-containing protein n=1 Tax=Taeniopygia guttata TaxID=59729 RepID=A0A674HL87_TAEGU